MIKKLATYVLVFLKQGNSGFNQLFFNFLKKWNCVKSVENLWITKNILKPKIILFINYL